MLLKSCFWLTSALSLLSCGVQMEDEWPEGQQRRKPTEIISPEKDRGFLVVLPPEQNTDFEEVLTAEVSYLKDRDTILVRNVVLGEKKSVPVGQGCIRIYYPGSNNAPLDCSVVIKKNQLTEYKLGALIVDFDLSKFQVDVGERAEVHISSSFESPDMAWSVKLFHDPYGSGLITFKKPRTGLLVAPGEYSLSYSPMILDENNRVVVVPPGKSLMENLDPKTEKRATVTLKMPQDRVFGSPLKEGDVHSILRTSDYYYHYANIDKDYDDESREIHSIVTTSLTSDQTFRMFVRSSKEKSDWKYLYVANNTMITLPLQDQPKSLEYAPKHLDVDHVAVPTVNGSISKIKGHYTLLKWKNNSWEPLRAGWRFNDYKFSTETGFDLLPGSYRVDVISDDNPSEVKTYEIGL